MIPRHHLRHRHLDRRTLARVAIVVAIVCMLPGCATTRGADPAAMSALYTNVIASPVRTEQDRRMDEERHPAQFLPFTGVRPGMQVLDVSAGGGYTSQLLALAVGARGTVWAQAPKPGATLVKRLADRPQPNLVVIARPFDDPSPGDAVKLDLVTLVLNYHDITYQPVDRTKMNAALYAALKPGGHFVVIDHSARSGTGISEGRTLHRIDEAVVLDEVRRAGFVLEAEGDFLRNPADTRGESSNRPKVPTDKFALRFVKP